MLKFRLRTQVTRASEVLVKIKPTDIYTMQNPVVWLKETLVLHRRTSKVQETGIRKPETQNDKCGVQTIHIYILPNTVEVCD